ncbi:MAG: hypothetical protein V2J51_12625 [Erythrobacter sp.]|jgi:DNA-binding transcriptional regulator LsrR (DeoR family)|nr:hypothetical protein [Erythrobacter sp.]
MTDNEGGLFAQLQDVKLLLIMQLLRDGVKQSQIAKTLGISDAKLSRMLPKGIGRELAKGKKVDEEEA